MSKKLYGKNFKFCVYVISQEAKKFEKIIEITKIYKKVPKYTSMHQMPWFAHATILTANL